MIVSASYRTDIPAFYADWLSNRLAAGWALVRNPYGGPPARVDLRPDAVDGFVFWTRNIGPAWPLLQRLAAPFVVQYTAIGYPRALDERVPPVEDAVGRIRALAGRWGRRAVVWRYDPIVITSATPPDWHRRQVARLAEALAGAVDEVCISFVEPYAKTRRNMAAAAAKGDFTWQQPDPAERQRLADDLAGIAVGHGIRLTACTQPGLAVPAAACVDADRLSDVAGHPIRARRKGNRPGCLCAESRDLGAYDTCPHGCAYCYAVRSRRRAVAAHRAHDPGAESL
jgi:hypothetical protein